jgi:c(7)-type cytochrome triheme protein
VAAAAYYGDVTMSRTTRRYGVPPAVFPHWAHRLQYTCAACHPARFEMKADAHEILMEKMVAKGTYCAGCHDGTTAFKPVNCSRCHRTDMPPLVAGRGNRDPLTTLAALPRDVTGRVDWMESIRRALIAPKAPPPAAASAAVPADSLMRRTGDLPPVVFPHASHARWLECRNCHPGVFMAKNGSNPTTMARMWERRDCGLCHGVVAFPMDDCTRCHRGRSQP